MKGWIALLVVALAFVAIAPAVDSAAVFENNDDVIITTAAPIEGVDNDALACGGQPLRNFVRNLQPVRRAAKAGKNVVRFLFRC